MYKFCYTRVVVQSWVAELSAIFELSDRGRLHCLYIVDFIIIITGRCSGSAIGSRSEARRLQLVLQYYYLRYF